MPGSSSGGFEQITAQTRFQSVEICACINKRVDVVCCSGSGRPEEGAQGTEESLSQCGSVWHLAGALA